MVFDCCINKKNNPEESKDVIKNKLYFLNQSNSKLGTQLFKSIGFVQPQIFNIHLTYTGL